MGKELEPTSGSDFPGNFCYYVATDYAFPSECMRVIPFFIDGSGQSDNDRGLLGLFSKSERNIRWAVHGHQRDLLDMVSA